MTTLHETAYPRIKANLTAAELRDVYTPSEAELAWAGQVAQSLVTRLAVLVHLKLSQRLGRFIPLSEVPAQIIRHVAHAAGYGRVPAAEKLASYDASGAKRAHVAKIRKFRGVHPFKPENRAWLRSVAERAAHTKGIIPDIINEMLDELVRHRYELPAFSTLERIAIKAREAVHETHYERIAARLTPSIRVLIDELLVTPPGSTRSGWQALKREPKRPTHKEVRSYLLHVRRLRQLAEQLPALDVPIPKLKHFREMARALDASELAELKPTKRYALATIFIRAQCGKTLDDVAELFIRLIRKLENTAQQKLTVYQFEHSQRADVLIGQLKDILDAYQVDGTDIQRMDAINGSLATEVSVLLAECEEHLAYAGRNYLPFLLRPYSSARPLLLNCLEIMGLHSSSSDDVMECLMKAVLALRTQRRQWVDAASLRVNVEKNLTWLSASWRKLVLPNASESKEGQLHRKYFELAVLVRIKNELKSGDLYIPQGERYDDYREQLVDEATFAQELGGYEEVSGIPTDASEFVRGLREQLTQTAQEVDQRFPENMHASVVDGRLMLKRIRTPEISQAVRTVDTLITERLPAISVVDVLIETSHWLQLHRHFRPIAGTDARIEELQQRVIATLFCYGCNLGPTQTARSIKGFSRRQIAWLNLKYVTEDTLDKATVEVINTFNKYELPGYWGSGKSASADLIPHLTHPALRGDR